MARWKKRNQINADEKTLRAQLDKGQSSGFISTTDLLKLIKELNTAYIYEEHFWKQKSQIGWLKDGDRNTKYVYACTKDRLARNRLLCIVDEKGVEHRGDIQIRDVDGRYFTDLFQSNPTNATDYEAVFAGFEP